MVGDRGAVLSRTLDHAPPLGVFVGVGVGPGEVGVIVGTPVPRGVFVGVGVWPAGLVGVAVAPGVPLGVFVAVGVAPGGPSARLYPTR